MGQWSSGMTSPYGFSAKLFLGDYKAEVVGSIPTWPTNYS